MFATNSVFETTLDISDVASSGVAMVTVYRNMYSSFKAKENKLAISLIYDKFQSDDYLKKNNLELSNNVMVQIMISGPKGDIN